MKRTDPNRLNRTDAIKNAGRTDRTAKCGKFLLSPLVKEGSATIGSIGSIGSGWGNPPPVVIEEGMKPEENGGLNA